MTDIHKVYRVKSNWLEYFALTCLNITVWTVVYDIDPINRLIWPLIFGGGVRGIFILCLLYSIIFGIFGFGLMSFTIIRAPRFPILAAGLEVLAAPFGYFVATDICRCSWGNAPALEWVVLTNFILFGASIFPALHIRKNGFQDSNSEQTDVNVSSSISQWPPAPKSDLID